MPRTRIEHHPVNQDPQLLRRGIVVDGDRTEDGERHVDVLGYPYWTEDAAREHFGPQVRVQHHRREIGFIGPADVVAVEERGGSRVNLTVRVRGEARVVEVVVAEDESAVALLVLTHVPEFGEVPRLAPSIVDRVPVELDAPVGDRVVWCGSSGERVEDGLW